MEGAMTSKLTAEMRLLCPAKGFIYVWQMPVRFSHWLSVLCILVLAGTGLYIHYPFFTYDNTLTQPYVMGQVRFVHYLTGIVFIFSVLLRLAYVAFGNEYANWKTFYNPFNKKDRSLIINYIKYYTFLEKSPKHTVTHNPIAQYAYIGIFLVFFFQILSGLYLWSLNDPNGSLHAALSWFNFIGNVQYIRMMHYFVIFIIATFLVVHLYAAALVDFRSRAGDISSIFSGWKTDVSDSEEKEEE
jgi:Ni/Fe-hydrogenase 1 B-type cytochrome subunit